MSRAPIAGSKADEASVGWLGLAATPVFAVMALLTAAQAGGPAAMLCSAATGLSPLGGMVPMYVLMSLFHSAPWVRLVSAARRSTQP